MRWFAAPAALLAALLAARVSWRAGPAVRAAPRAIAPVHASDERRERASALRRAGDLGLGPDPWGR